MTKKVSRVLFGINYELPSGLGRFLEKRGILPECVNTLDEIIECVGKKFYSVAVIDVSGTDTTLIQALTKIKSNSHKTEIIAVSDEAAKISEDGDMAKDTPLRDLVYAFVEAPVKESYLATLIIKAIEKLEPVQHTGNGHAETEIEKAPLKNPGAGGQALMLSASVNSLHSAVTITDMDQNILYVNRAHERTFGFSPEELTGKKSMILYPADDPYGLSGKIYEAILMVGWEGERLGIKKDGSAFPIYEKTSVIKDADGHQIGIVSVVDDISSRKTLELALKESEERYRTFVETAKSAIIAVSEESKIILYNPSAEKLFGYTMEEVLEKDFSMLFPQRHSAIHRPEQNHGNGEDGSVFEIEGLNNTGEEFPIEVSLSSCRLEGRQVVTAIIFDITERKHLQEQVVQSAKLAAVGELISGVTHEVNNPLAVVIGYSEMMLEEPGLDEDSRQALESINKEAERAKKVIQNLLSFARKHSPEKEIIQINEVLEKTLGLTRYEFKKSRVNVIKELDPELPEIVADPNQLQQVFLNLIMNAQHAMGTLEDGKELRIKSGFKDGRNRLVQILFEDNGTGIPADKLPKIFDPFYTTKPKGMGTGLGLSVSFGIIKEHGGDIYAENNKKKGASFIIELPFAGDGD